MFSVQNKTVVFTHTHIYIQTYTQKIICVSLVELMKIITFFCVARV